MKDMIRGIEEMSVGEPLESLHFSAPGLLPNDQVETYIERAKASIEEPLDKRLIKERDAGGGKKLSYISGSTVINLLNKAFNYRWNFEIVQMEVVQSLPKYNKYKEQFEEQQPYIQVKGRLEIPHLGIVKEQVGTKILLGGASEQEGAAKAATTDALKKCATLLGIGLELYDDVLPEQTPYSKPKVQSTPAKKATPKPEAVKPAPRNPDGEWDDLSIKKQDGDLKRLTELKAIFGITENSMLDVYTKEFFNDKDADFSYILPGNIVKFNEFLVSKAPGA